MFRNSLAIHVFCLIAASAALAAPSGPSAESTPEIAAADAGRPTVEEAGAVPPFAGGALQAQDPAIRAQIRALFAERDVLHEETFDAIETLNADYAGTTDPATRRLIAAELAGLKAGLEIRNLELQLEIAILEEDAPRVQEIELALERSRHPEAYRAQFTVDPSLEQQRLRELGLE